MLHILYKIKTAKVTDVGAHAAGSRKSLGGISLKKLSFFLVLMLISTLLSSFALAQDEPIEITTVRSSVGDRILTFISRSGENDEDNRWTRLIEEELGIKIKYNWIAGSVEEYDQKLNLSLASGDMPDFIKFTSLSQVHQAVEAGYVQDARPLFDEYASPLLKEIYALDNEVEFNACTFAGILGAIPKISPAQDTYQSCFIRKDWLDKLGLQEPKSQQDLLAIMEAFVTKDPDGNGKDDTYALGISDDLWSDLYNVKGFACAYGAYPSIWYDDGNGKVIFGSVQPEMKAMLSQLNEMYEKGWIDPEFVVNDVGENVIGGKIGVVYGPAYVPWITQASHNFDGAMWQAYVLPHVSEPYAKTTGTSSTAEYYGINVNAKHPEALIQILNLFAEKCWGETAQADVYFGAGDAEGMYHLCPFNFLHPYNNYLIMEGIEKGLVQGSSEGIFAPAVGFYNGVMLYREQHDELAWANEFVMSPNPYSTTSVNKFQRDNNLVVTAARAWTQAEEDRGVVCEKLLNDSFIKMIMGEMPVDDFDKVVDEWYKLGGEAISQEMNAWYGANQ